MEEPITLLPVPRQMHVLPGRLQLPARGTIALIGDVASTFLPAAYAAQNAIEKATTCRWPIIAGTGGRAAGIRLTLAIDADVARAEGYRLAIDQACVRINAATPRGLFYGVQTLVQLLRQFGDHLPFVQIEDWPDFPARGVMLDISRDKVPTMATLYAIVDQLAEWKINQLQLYTEHTFAYRAHPEPWATASPMTGEDILALDAYCRERFIELVPNQNSFGHLERWLRLPKYKPLAEAPNGSKLPWGSRWDGPAGLCPLDPGSLKLVSELYDELLPHFSSRMFNVGCDETFDLGQGRSQAECEKRGKERVYLDFLLKIHEQVRSHGRTMQFWGDIILHKPELIHELPKDTIALQWGYFATHPYDRDGQHFKNAGIPFYVCPGTSSWQSFLSRTDNALANIKNAAENGLKHGAIGFLNTDWGDVGHHQYLSGSLLTLAFGGALGWCVESNREIDLVRAVDIHVFQDAAGVMSRLAFDLGNVYKLCLPVLHAASPLFRILVPIPGEPINPTQSLTVEQLVTAEAEIARIMPALDRARMNRPDAGLVIDEFKNAAGLMTHACRLGQFHHRASMETAADLATDLRHLIGEHRRLWLARNRIGGLAESSRRLEASLDFYAS